MIRVKNFNSTGVAPDGRLYAGDLLAIQDAAAGLADFTQTIDLSTLRIGDSSIQLLKFGTAEARISAALRTDGILRGLGGHLAGAFTTAARNAIAAGSRPYGLVILNTTTNQYEWNKGSDAVPDWQPLGAVIDLTATWNFTGILQNKGMRVHRHPYANDRHIESGNASQSGLSNATTYDFAVSFTDAFVSNPNVATGFDSSVAGDTSTLYAVGRSTTGMTLRFRNINNGNNVTVFYIVEGQD